MPPEPASQTLTFLFTDIEGSTQLWEHHQQAMKDALERPPPPGRLTGTLDLGDPRQIGGGRR